MNIKKLKKNCISITCAAVVTTLTTKITKSNISCDTSFTFEFFQGSFYCSKPLSAKKQRRASQMSAPAISWMRPQEEARILDADGTFPNIDA